MNLSTAREVVLPAPGGGILLPRILSRLSSPS